MRGVKSANRYENMMHWRAFSANYEKSKCGFWTAERVKRDIWDSVIRILQKRAIFEETRACVSWNRQFRTNFGLKTLECCSSCVSEALGAWNSCKNIELCTKTHIQKPVPAGLARHVRDEKCKSVWRIWCIDVRFRQITKYHSTDSEHQNAWNVIFWIWWHMFYKNVPSS